MTNSLISSVEPIEVSEVGNWIFITDNLVEISKIARRINLQDNPLEKHIAQIHNGTYYLFVSCNGKQDLFCVVIPLFDPYTQASRLSRLLQMLDDISTIHPFTYDAYEIVGSLYERPM